MTLTDEQIIRQQIQEEKRRQFLLNATFSRRKMQWERTQNILFQVEKLLDTPLFELLPKKKFSKMGKEEIKNKQITF